MTPSPTQNHTLAKVRNQDFCLKVKDFWGRKEFLPLKKILHEAGTVALRDAWPEFSLLQRAALFKLLEPEFAMEFYLSLGTSEKYFLLGAFEMGCIAPILEGLPPVSHCLFRRLTEEHLDDMLRSVR